MIVDYHNHTYMCGHARGEIREIVESAISKGLAQIGIADHLPLLYTEDRSLSMAPEELPLYVEEVLGLRELYGDRIAVRLGIEADFHLPTLDGVAGMLESYPFDFVIGSVHIIGDWIFDDPREKHRYRNLDIDAFYLEYLKTECAMMDTGLFDILGHADLVKKFGHRPGTDLAPYYRELLEKTKAAGACYEVNTAGLRWPVNEIYPEPGFVKLGSQMSVPVTLGSDSHCPEDVGRDFDKALALIEDAGYSEIATFEGRRMSLVPI